MKAIPLEGYAGTTIPQAFDETGVDANGPEEIAMNEIAFHYIMVDAGGAGAVLAARLSEEQRSRAEATLGWFGD